MRDMLAPRVGFYSVQYSMGMSQSMKTVTPHKGIALFTKLCVSWASTRVKCWPRSADFRFGPLLGRRRSLDR